MGEIVQKDQEYRGKSQGDRNPMGMIPPRDMEMIMFQERLPQEASKERNPREKSPIKKHGKECILWGRSAWKIIETTRESLNAIAPWKGLPWGLMPRQQSKGNNEKTALQF